MTEAATDPRPASWKILLAFAIIYLVWGSTFLAIRVGVREMPPFLMAGLRFTAAGLALYGWMRLTGVPNPSRVEWRGAHILGTLMFLIDYACVFWAEQRVPSGVTAVVLASIPVCIALLEIVFLRTQRLSVRLSLGLLVGIVGVGSANDPFCLARRSSARPRRSHRAAGGVFGMVGRHHRQPPHCAAAVEAHERRGANALRRGAVTDSGGGKW